MKRWLNFISTEDGDNLQKKGWSAEHSRYKTEELRSGAEEVLKVSLLLSQLGELWRGGAGVALRNWAAGTDRHGTGVPPHLLHELSGVEEFAAAVNDLPARFGLKDRDAEMRSSCKHDLLSYRAGIGPTTYQTLTI